MCIRDRYKYIYCQLVEGEQLYLQHPAISARYQYCLLYTSTSIDSTEEIGKAFIENTFSVILDLTVKYDEINGLTVLLAEWKKGNEGSGVVDP